ncbi:hypothetical protein NPIL_396851 [Nephila pilipes]|uniref:Uncharacterized protein n=1 Tax=Nephila pilipes TaxID=299642 RepID=A0A8X6Q2G2_NEPPI|nr:hypothetical protein NPIL_396851 [Nephila pilipes]
MTQKRVNCSCAKKRAEPGEVFEDRVSRKTPLNCRSSTSGSFNYLNFITMFRVGGRATLPEEHSAGARISALGRETSLIAENPLCRRPPGSSDDKVQQGSSLSV